MRSNGQRKENDLMQIRERRKKKYRRSVVCERFRHLRSNCCFRRTPGILQTNREAVYWSRLIGTSVVSRRLILDHENNVEADADPTQSNFVVSPFELRLTKESTDLLSTTERELMTKRRGKWENCFTTIWQVRGDFVARCRVESEKLFLANFIFEINSTFCDNVRWIWSFARNF